MRYFIYKTYVTTDLLQNWDLDIFKESLFTQNKLSILPNSKLVLRISESDESPIIYTVLS